MAYKIKLIYTYHARKRMRKRNFTELDIENALKLGKKISLYDEPNKYAFQFQIGKRKYEVICYIFGNLYKVKTVYPL